MSRFVFLIVTAPLMSLSLLSPREALGNPAQGNPRAAAPDVVTCQVGGKETCEEVRLKFEPLTKSYFSEMPMDIRKQKFMEWMKPASLFVQAHSGLAASVIVAQAGEATEWGTSLPFTKFNSLFGNVCYQSKVSHDGRVEIGSKVYPYRAYCGPARPARQGGRYVSYSSYSDSLLAYVSMVLKSRGPQFSDLQHVVKRSRTRSPGIAGFRSLMSSLRGYSAEPAYAQKIGELITNLGLSALEMDACQKCLYDSTHPSPAAQVLRTPATVPPTALPTVPRATAAPAPSAGAGAPIYAPTPGTPASSSPGAQ
ncbi:MAG: glucosaminidase domain-containing protein [Bdellovibrionales bacterium]